MLPFNEILIRAMVSGYSIIHIHIHVHVHVHGIRTHFMQSLSAEHVPLHVVHVCTCMYMYACGYVHVHLKLP